MLAIRTVAEVFCIWRPKFDIWPSYGYVSSYVKIQWWIKYVGEIIKCCDTIRVSHWGSGLTITYRSEGSPSMWHFDKPVEVTSV